MKLLYYYSSNSLKQIRNNDSGVIEERVKRNLKIMDTK